MLAKTGCTENEMSGTAGICAGVKLFIGSKVQCMFCFEIFTPEGRGEEVGGNANFKTKHTEEPLTQEITSPLLLLEQVQLLY